MFAYLWPIALVVLSNTVYQICAKSVPERMDPFASLTVSYLVATLVSAIFYFSINKGGNFVGELQKANWSPFVLGMVIVGLEVGYIFAFRAGWQVSMASIVQGSVLAVVLVFVGWLLFQEELTWNKLVGIVICMIGLIFINYKK